MLNYYLIHQEEVVTRRTKYDLNKAEERAHILQGLLTALDNIDEVINIYRSSQEHPGSKRPLNGAFFADGRTGTGDRGYASACADRSGTREAGERIRGMMERITELKAILADKKKLLGVIREEILLIADKYGDDRRTIHRF